MLIINIYLVKPEVEISYDRLTAELDGEINLICTVKSLTPVNTTWRFGEEKLIEKSAK